MSINTSNPLGNRNLNDTDVDGLIAWEEKNGFVKAEINPFIDIVKTLKRNRIHRVVREQDICNNDTLMAYGWLDHWCLYTDKNKNKVFTSSPYADRTHNADQVKKVEKFCEKNGLVLEIIDGFYSPGSIMYVIKDGDAPDMGRFYKTWDLCYKLFKPLLRSSRDNEKFNFLSYVVRNIYAYLFFKNERYARVDMYFEHENGEKQHKAIVFGEPSDSTPERFKGGDVHGGGVTA